jgi:hypothetical protein
MPARTITPSQIATFSQNKDGILTGKGKELARKVIGFVASVNCVRRDEKKCSRCSN